LSNGKIFFYFLKSPFTKVFSKRDCGNSVRHICLKFSLLSDEAIKQWIIIF